MIAFPNCKINLGLNILRKKEDGYHDLETFFFPIPIHDALEILPSEDSKTHMISSGIDTGKVENNICLKAYHLLEKDYPQLPEVNIHLHKAIPLGSGMGGGSADGAFTLQLLNKKFNLNISQQRISSYALELGSDCPFFIINKPALASERGETLTPLDFSLNNYKIVIINPGIHVSTTEAFKNIIPAMPSKSIKEIIQQPISTWKNDLVNDFEKPIFIKHPEIKEIKDSLYSEGAVYASMSGSGSSVFGIFDKEAEPANDSPKNYFYKIIQQGVE